jgi:predicted Zn finger-like uncharacterized protein
MLIVCPNCATSYRVEPSSLGAAGRSVRCVRCRTVWFARDPGAISAVAQTYRSDAAALTTSVSAADLAEPEASPPVADTLPDEPPPAAEMTEVEHVPEETTTALDAGPAEDAPSLAAESQDHELPQPQEPVAMADAPALALLERYSAALPADAPPAEDIETFAARQVRRRAARRRAHWPLPGLPTAILALVALDAALIGWRADVVRFVPQTASLYAAIGLPVNLRGLAFANVASATETHDGVPVLVVEGTIVSAKDRVTEVPRLRFSVRNQNGQEVYAWTALPGRSVLAPGETLAFRSRLASPPPEAHDVLVRFFNRRDRVAGIQ